MQEKNRPGDAKNVPHQPKMHVLLKREISELEWHVCFSKETCMLSKIPPLEILQSASLLNIGLKNDYSKKYCTNIREKVTLEKGSCYFQIRV